jgi:hypothetical protein
MEEKDIKPRFGVVNFERRKNRRFSLDLPIEYCRVDSSGNRSGRALNASEGGLLAYLPERVEIGQYLRLRLFITPGLDLQTLEMVAQVAWVDMPLDQDREDYRGDYRSGLKIVDISPEAMNSLKSLLQDLAK